MRKLSVILLFSVALSGVSQTMMALGLVPIPRSCVERKGEFVFGQKTTIHLSPDTEEMRNAVAVMTDLFATAATYQLPIVSRAAGSGIVVCQLDAKIKSAEGYQLEVTPRRIVIKAARPTGIFYAMQTLRQLLPPQIESQQPVKEMKWSVPCVKIEDEPTYAYRGFMLDVCRHFMPKEQVKRYIDLLAFHKINTLHWHLTEDQGWRIEIKKYPKLTEVGAFRNRTLKGHYQSKEWDWTIGRYGGFYTQDDIREVVAYASKRFVTIIPEIEMPGHAVAALAAYPEYSCSGGPFEVAPYWGVFNDIYCTRDEVFTFLEDVLDEVAALFPSEYIHIGGDEAPKVRWQRCYACQKRMEKEGLKDEHELQSYFVKRIEKHLQTLGKRMIGWDEILEGGVSKTATVMSWRGEKGGIQATALGNEVIMTPTTYLYLDYYQAPKEGEPLAIGGYLPLEKVYSYEPKNDQFTPEQAKLIKGVQANLWTEYIPTWQQVDYMAFPRLAALAEIGWALPQQKEYSSFINRLVPVMNHYDVLGVNYCKKHIALPQSGK